MKQLKVLLIAAVVMMMVSVGVFAEFRGLEWGASSSEVAYNEGYDYFTNEDNGFYHNIAYQRQVLTGVSSDVIFYLESGGLSKGFITFPMSARDRVIAAMDSKYGGQSDLSYVADLGFEPASMEGWETDETFIAGFEQSGKYLLVYNARFNFETPETDDTSGF